MADKAKAWWKMPTSYKELLQKKRYEGEFGGADSVAIGRAPYFWGQEYGNPAADISPQHFVTGPDGSFELFHSTFVAIMTEGITT
jgi:hypothetical protein